MSDILTDLKWRYATKQFDPEKKIPEDQFQKLLDTLVLTPSSYGLQPWKFVVVENPELRKQLQPVSWNQAQVVDASHLIVFCIRTHIDEAYVQKFVDLISDVQHRDEHALEMYKNMMVSDVIKGPRSKIYAQWAKDQTYIALGNAMTVAATMRIDACPMEGFEPEKYDEILGLTEMGLAATVVLPVGYRSANDKYADLAKVRFAKEDLVVTI